MNRKRVTNIVGSETAPNVSVCFGNSFVVDDFKVLQSEKNLFVRMPSRPDGSSATGYRDTAKPITAQFRATLIGAVVAAHHTAIEKLQNRAAAVEAPAAEKPSIKEQLEAGAKQAAKEASQRTERQLRKSGNPAKPYGFVGRGCATEWCRLQALILPYRSKLFPYEMEPFASGSLSNA